MSGHRAERVADRIRQVLARVIQSELRDPRISFVTITEVKLSPDLKNARIFVTTLGDQDVEAAVEGLNHAVPFLRRTLAGEGGLRYTPRLVFVRDHAEESARRVDDILARIRDEDEAESP